jgi:uncharacterized protein (DUF2225 family)
MSWVNSQRANDHLLLYPQARYHYNYEHFQLFTKHAYASYQFYKPLTNANSIVLYRSTFLLNAGFRRFFDDARML